MNCSYFPDDYDDNKEKQSYEDQDNYEHFYIKLKKLPACIQDVISHYFGEFADQVVSWFTLIDPNAPIDADTITVTTDAGNLEIKYKYKQDISNDVPYEELRDECAESITDLFEGMMDSTSKAALCRRLAEFICRTVDAINYDYQVESKFSEFMARFTACLDESEDSFYDLLDSYCDNNDWIKTAQNTDFEATLTEILSKFSIDKLWSAFIYTKPYTYLRLGSVM